MKTLAQRLKEAREWKGWTQAQLAVAADVSTGTIGNIESGARLSKGSIPQIAEALGISYQWLANQKGDMLAATASITAPSPALVGTLSSSNHAISSVDSAKAAISNIATSNECAVICAAFVALPDDPILRTRVMAEVMTVISRAQGPPAHKAYPETGAQRAA